MDDRVNIKRLIKDVEDGYISHIFTEGIDRISRNQADMARFYQICQYHHVEIRSVMEGVISEIHVGLTSTMSAVFLEQLSHRVRRGQKDNISQGKAAGGLPYGYKVKHLNDRGEPEKGLREIIPEKAVVIRRIYDEFIDGRTPSDIARDLNRDNIPSQRGKHWTPSTLTGHHGRGNGILQNPIYTGQLIWNRHNFKRHPVTGIRHVRGNSKTEWVVSENLDLQIIPTDVWDKAQKIINKRRIANAQSPKKQTFPTLDIEVFCVRCSGKMHRHSEKYLTCGIYQRTKRCDHKKRINTATLIEVIYYHLCSHLDNVWMQWQLEADEENKRQSEQRKSIYQQTLHLDNTCKLILSSALDKVKHDPKPFVTEIVKTATIDTDNTGAIIVHALRPDWTALAKVK
jgi:DNA invertase Pin-like site-specific DNA recombinase